MALHRRTLSALVACGTGLGIASVAPAQAATPTHTYQHGLYAQAHFNSSASCALSRANAVAYLNDMGASSVSSGDCHAAEFGSGISKISTYLYDVTYRSNRKLWPTDNDLGATPAASAGAHSFRDKYTSSSLADATRHYNVDVQKVKSLPGGTITSVKRVARNTATGHYEYQLNYNSRVPAYPNHVQISERPGVTSPTTSTPSTPSTPTTPTVPTKPTTPTKPTVPTVPTTPTVPATGMITTSNTSSTPSGQVVNKYTGQVLGIQGLDISAHTGFNDWAGWSAAGVKFIYTKATEGTYYKNPQFSAQYSGAYNAGMIRGSYHFANPATTDGATQADYFINNGGGWSNDGRTLPGVIDLEWNPYANKPPVSDMCYGLTKTQMNTWVRSFINEYRLRTGVNPAIYTARIWWNTCVGTADYTDIPLWIAQYPNLTGMPTSWSGTEQMIWQNAAIDSKGFDTNIFNGSLFDLQRYATTGRQ